MRPQHERKRCMLFVVFVADQRSNNTDPSQADNYEAEFIEERFIEEHSWPSGLRRPTQVRISSDA